MTVLLFSFGANISKERSPVKVFLMLAVFKESGAGCIKGLHLYHQGRLGFSKHLTLLRTATTKI